MKDRHKSLHLFVAAVAFWALSPANTAVSQDVYQPRVVGVIDPGKTINVRTIETIYADESDGRVFSAVVAQDVLDRKGNLAIQKESAVELIVKRAAGNELALDLDSITINGHRYALQTEENVTDSQTDEGGALLGVITGAIAGGRNSAAMGAGAQVRTRGGRIDVPADSLLTFRLDEPLRPEVTERGYMRDGIHYHYGYLDAK